MSEMIHVGTQVDEAMMGDIDQAARSMDRSAEAFVHYAPRRVLDEEAELTAFIQPGVDFADSEPLVDHVDIVEWMAERRGARRAA
jgi:predicted transcriptional regulator